MEEVRYKKLQTAGFHLYNILHDKTIGIENGPVVARTEGVGGGAGYEGTRGNFSG